ncbi:Sigma-54 dependent response regulator [Stigmatella aurantiaca DW4/3-1]|uniref:Sigma-54 dependent response regulator n=1 Tax=Stigmatella aurantiaca (strain DW4/3-1) TaxID=378806 RepID=Q08VA9_STIAD|nr:Sigma-54 dependent response regulator [Stigmatella aurantiaca DW4/3-1]EAU64419.1 sigma-54 dependent response regulator [Stigmatella aurantiaca DW4/3-1]
MLDGRTRDDGRVDPQVSREHARISAAGGGWRLEALAARNRIRLNGAVLSDAAPIQPGDVIRLGSTLLLFAVAPAGPAPSDADPELLGDGQAMRAVHQDLSAVALRANSVLVTGETGTGKELVARALHRKSGRPGTLVALNCGELAEGIIESELFGHARGAFTGAVSSREGLFQSAQRGTLFLDEIGEMPLGLQVKLCASWRLAPCGPLASRTRCRSMSGWWQPLTGTWWQPSARGSSGRISMPSWRSGALLVEGMDVWKLVP